MQKCKQFISKVGLSVPIIQAPMANVSTVELASVVAQSGGLGSLALSPIDLAADTEPVFRQISEFRQKYKHGGIVNCNFFCFDPAEQHVPSIKESDNWVRLYEGATGAENAVLKEKVEKCPRAVVSFQEFVKSHPKACDAFVDRLVQEQVGVVSFHFGIPSLEIIQKLQKGGVLVFGCITSVKEAQKLIDLKVDALVCQGYEAGGHRGNFIDDSSSDENLSTSALFDQVQNILKSQNSPPFLIPSGGIVDGKTVADYLLKGAAAVQMGTVFIPTKESSAPGFIASCINEKKQVPTIMTPLVSGRNARTLRTPFIEALSREQTKKRFELPSFGYSTSAYRKFASGKAECGFFLAGQNYHLVATGKSGSEVMEALKEGIDERLGEV